MEFFQRSLTLDGTNGEIWGALGHCYLMLDELQKAYAAYQQALYHLPNPKVASLFLSLRFSSPFVVGLLSCPTFSHLSFVELCLQDPKLWYGIGILYDRYGSFEHAEEAFTAVLKMDPKFEKSNEIYFRLGIIYKQQQKYDTSLEVTHTFYSLFVFFFFFSFCD